MSNMSDVRSALAARAATVSGIREATHSDLSGVGKLPAVKITDVILSETLERGASYELREVEIQGWLIIAKPGDIGRATAIVEQYAEALQVAHRTGVLLGLPTYVQDSALARWNFQPIEVGGVEYPGAELVYSVRVRENVTRTA